MDKLLKTLNDTLLGLFIVLIFIVLCYAVPSVMAFLVVLGATGLFMSCVKSVFNLVKGK